MGKITRSHSLPYCEPKDLQSRLVELQVLIASIRDCMLVTSSKKRMLNHALWEVSHALGNFTPEFRTRGVIDGTIGTKIQRDHVYKRKQIVQDILSQKQPLEETLKRVIHCVVTEEEHNRLTRLPEYLDGWERYKAAGVEV